MRLKLLFLLLMIFQISHSQIAKIQFIHNAPDISITEVDVYVDDILVVDNLAFKTGSAFIEVPFDGNMAQISISNATDESDVFVSLERMLVDQENYYAVIDGILDTDAYTDVEPFGIYVYAGAQLEAINIGALDILVHHGAIGFDHTLDVQGTQILAFPLEMARTLSFSEYSDEVDGFPYSMWESQGDIAVEIGDYGGNIGGGLLSDFEFNFNFELPSESVDLENQAILMLLSGFQNPEVNNDGQPFDVFYLTPEGGDFRSATLSVDDITVSSMIVYPNPVQEMLTIKTFSSQAKGALYDVQGRLIYENISIDNTTTIDLSALKSGVYFLQLTDQNNNASTVRRIIKK